MLGEYQASFSLVSTIDFKSREVVSLSANSQLVLESFGGRSGVSGHPQAGVSKNSHFNFIHERQGIQVHTANM